MDKSQPSKERRHFERFDTDAQVHFRVTYEFKTKVRFQIVNDPHVKNNPPKYPALGQNVSAQGLCFISNRQLSEGDVLFLEVFVPGIREPLFMNGEVAWCRESSEHKGDEFRFAAGVKLIDVNGQPVDDSIHYDEENNITWSNVLESVFGSFRVFVEKARKRQK